MKVQFDSVFDSILHGEFPNNIGASNIKTKLVSNKKKLPLVSLNQTKSFTREFYCSKAFKIQKSP